MLEVTFGGMCRHLQGRKNKRARNNESYIVRTVAVSDKSQTRLLLNGNPKRFRFFKLARIYKIISKLVPL
jgi:hypothetical protein